MSLSKYYYPLLRPAIFQIKPETAHEAAISALSNGLVPAQPTLNYPELAQTIAGIKFPNPVGLAPGFDKNAKALKGLQNQGFGFIETGTVTPKPQPGNSKPRMFRLVRDEAVINRLGFNNEGIDTYLKNLQAFKKYQRTPAVIGCNIGKNKNTVNAALDYAILIDRCYEEASYITINISSPNTEGLRDLQHKEQLDELLAAIAVEKKRKKKETTRDVPLFLKIAPDMSFDQADTVLEVALKHKLDALIISNTTIGQRDILTSSHKDETGGLSGKPLFAPSTELLRHVAKQSKGKIALIGVGGIFSGENAYTKIKAGASLVQLYTGLVYKGFGLVTEINQYLHEALARDGFEHISEAVGKDL